MPKYVIEREIAGAGSLTAAQLKEISQTSCDTIEELDNRLQWLQTFVTDDKCYCVYISPNEGLIREHAKRGGFPANKISRVSAIIDPVTAEEPVLVN
jgi:hypothetical protein